MALVSITADVHCDTTENSPAYRVYVDNDLLTERTWIWPPYDQYICEHIEVNLEPGQHQLRIEKCSSHGNFTVKNFTVNGEPIHTQDLLFNIQ